MSRTLTCRARANGLRREANGRQYVDPDSDIGRACHLVLMSG